VAVTMTGTSSRSSGGWLLFAACVLIGLLNEVSGGVLTVALPQVKGELGVSQVGAQLILTTAKLFFGALILAGGALGDVYGRKRVLLLGVIVVVVSSGLSAMADSAGVLMAARALDGIGNAMVGPLALAMAVGGFADDQRARIVSLFAGFSALGMALGPLGASMLVQALGWRLGFLSPLLIGIVGGLGVWVLAYEAKRAGEVGRVDYVGAVLCAAGLLGLVFGCARATEAGWLSRVVMLPVGLGVLSLIAFSWWERRTRHPLLDIRLFKNRTIIIAIIVVMAISLSVSGSFLPLFYFLQTGQHHNPVGAVVRLLPLVLTAAALAPVVGMAATRIGHRRTIAAGLLVAAAGSAVLAFALHPHTAYPVLLVSLMLLGAGNIAVIGPAQDLLLGSVPPERQGGAAALGSAAIQIGGALGLPIMVSALLATARPVFYEQMRQVTGLTDPEIRNAVAAIRRGMYEATTERAFEVPAALRAQIREAGEVAFGIGVAQCFLVAAIACVLCAVLVWVGAQRQAQDVSDRLPQSAT
jgi:EmrB/QacA subfamily drug resistance transporter